MSRFFATGGSDSESESSEEETQPQAFRPTVQAFPGGSMPNTSSSVPYLLSSSMQSIRSRRTSTCLSSGPLGSGLLQQLGSGMYNCIYEKPESAELEKLVLDFDEETEESLLKVDSGILKKLKPHQAAGVKFMWDACFETIKQAQKTEGSGCILAHCMGLGKTLQVITLTHTLLTNSRITHIERVLVITPLSTVTNYVMSKYKDKNSRSFKLNEWFEEGGVCIIGYDMYRILSNEKAKGVRKKQREIFQKCLVDPGPDMVICDEGHLLKNEKTSLSQAVTKMRTKRRIVLTGTPVQNNLKEYYCMIQFVKPSLLGTYKEYLNRFANPITNGQYTDSTERDTRLMKHRSHILHKLLEGCIQRRDYSILAPYLPPKHEYSVFITMSDLQQSIYEYYMTKQRDNITDITGKGAKLFQDFQNLRIIWTHPMCLRVNSDIVMKKKFAAEDSDDEGSIKDFVIESSEEETSSSSENDSFNSDQSIESDIVKKGRNTRNVKHGSDIDDIPVPIEKEDPSEWWCQLVPKEELTNIAHSPKLTLLMNILHECEAIGDKLLLFSQFLQSLDVIEEFLSLIDRKTQGKQIEGNVEDFTGSWQPGVDYFRLDGSCSVENREIMCRSFNDVKNLRARLFLISTRAGSLGINLVAANRVIIFDVSWNPSHDTQSIFRVYRFGQEKTCYIYRFIGLGTMEQKVYERQVVKQSTAKRVIDEQQIGRHYNQNDLLELYSYELKPRVAREIPILPKDRLFAELFVFITDDTYTKSQVLLMEQINLKIYCFYVLRQKHNLKMSVEVGVKVEKIKTTRGDLLLAINGFEYHFDGGKSWRCTKRKSLRCLALLKEKDDVVIEVRNEHYHAPDLTQSKKRLVANKIKEAASSSIRGSTSKIYQSILSKEGKSQEEIDNLALILPEKESCLTLIRRNYKKVITQKEPQDITFEIPEEVQLFNERKFVQADITFQDGSKTQRFIIMFYDESFDYLVKSKVWMSDGTFKVVPKIFYQLYTIFGKIDDENKLFPLAFVLMTGKSRNIYDRVHMEFRQLAEKRGQVLSPQYIICDFEHAAMKSMEVSYGTSIHGCYFHLAKNIYGKIRKEVRSTFQNLALFKIFHLANFFFGEVRKEGLQITFINDMEFQKAIRMLAALPFFKPDDISDLFMKITECYPGKSLRNIYMYFENTYIKQSALFPPATWTNYNFEEMNIPRTQNIIESWHSKIIKTMGGAHLGVFQIIDELQEESISTLADIKRAENGLPRTPRKKRNNNMAVSNILNRAKSYDSNFAMLSALAEHIRFTDVCYRNGIDE